MKKIKVTLENETKIEPTEPSPTGGVDEEETIEFGNDEDGAVRQSSFEREYEDNGQYYRPYSVYVGEVVSPADEDGEHEVTKNVDIYINDELTDTFQYNTLFNFMRKISKVAELVTIYISCPGGDIETLSTFLNVIEEMKWNCFVLCVVQGQACSAASILALAGDHTVFQDFSYIMFHSISLALHAQKEHGAIVRSLDCMKDLYEKMLKAYGCKILTPKEIKAILDDGKEIYLSSEEATKRYEKWDKEQERLRKEAKEKEKE